MSEEETPPVRPKLILPDATTQAPSNPLLVPGVELLHPEVAPAVVVSDDDFVVINEDPVEPVVEPEVEPDAPAVASGPVKITAMTPPPVAKEIVAEEEAVSDAPEGGEEILYQEPEPVAEYAEPVVEYAEPAAPEVYQAPPVYEQAPVPQPVVPAVPVYPPQPGYAPPQPEAYPQPQPGYPPPVHQGELPQGYGVAPGVPALQVMQPAGVPSWALFFFGLLGGFLITLALFKFTALAEGLRPDLIERGKQLVKTTLQSSNGAEDEESDEDP